MMKIQNQIIKITISVLSVGMFFGQTGNVGISTENPQQKLHISGTSAILDNNIGTTGIPLISPTVRVDGLNRANNPTIFTSDDTTQPLYVNNLGQSNIVKGIEPISNTAVGDDAITTSVQLNYPNLTTGEAAYRVTGALITASFTLSQRSVVYITSSLSAQITNTSNTVLNDTNHKTIVATITFTNAPASTGLTTSFALTDTTTYASGTASSINNFKLSPSGEVVLPPGDYTIILRGGTIGAINRAAYRVFFGGQSGDKLNVFAKPL